MTSEPSSNVCPRCREPAVADSPECKGCGYPFSRLCDCGKAYGIFDGVCPGCGRVHRRGKARRRKRASVSLLDRLKDGLSAPFERMASRRRHRNRKSAPRAYPSVPKDATCPKCAAPLPERVEACGACGTDLGLLCRCDGRYNRVFDTACPKCGKPLHHRKKVGRRLGWLVTGGVMALLAIGVVGWFAIPRGGAGRTAGYYDEGQTAFLAGQYDRAIGWFRKFIDASPKHAAAHFMLGQALYLSGKKDPGLAEVRKAVEFDPDLPEPQLFLGKVAREEGRSEEALGFLRRAIRGDHPSPLAYLLIGEIEIGEGRISLGTDALARALAIPMDPAPVEAALTLADILAERARLLGRTEDATEARRYYSLAAAWIRDRKDYDADPRANALLARACLGGQVYTEALFRAGRAAPKLAGAERADMILLQARALAGQGAPEQAGALARKALEEDPTPARRIAVARMLGDVGDAAGRAAALEAARGEHPERMEVWIAWSDDQAEEGKAGAAAAVLRGEAERFRDDPRYYLQLSSLLRRGGDDDAALAVLAEARQRFPADRDLRLRELGARVDIVGGGAERPEAERWRAVVAEVDEILAAEPDHPVALLLKGKTLLYESRSVEALRYLKDAQAIDPLDLEIAIFAAFTYYRSGNYEEAAARLGRVLARTGAELPTVRLALADCYHRLRLFDRAAEAAGRVVRLDPRRADARRMLGRVLIASEKYEEARREFEALQSLDPASVETALYLGYLNLQTGRTEEAEEAFAQARGLAKSPEDAFRVARVEADYYRRMRKIDRALEVYEGFLAANPSRADAQIGMADFLLSLGRPEDALQAYRKCLAVDPDNVDARRRICEFRFEAGDDFAEVERQIAEIERRAPSVPDAFYLRGKLATARNDPKGGVKELEEYVRLRPEDPDGQYALGISLFKAGRVDDAVTRLEAAQGLIPESAPMRQALGQVVQARAAQLYSAGDYEGARVLLERALRYDPGLTDARMIMASSLARLGQLAGSEEYALAVVRREPENLQALRLLGSIRLGRGNLEDAADAYQRAVAVSDNPSYDRYLLASIYLRMGNADRALEEARKAAAGSEDPLFAGDVVVAALLSKNQAPAADEFLRGILARAPENARAHSLLGVVLRFRKDFTGAKEAFCAALDFDPKLYGALWQLVTMEIDERGDRNAALEEAKFRYEAAPDDPELNYVLAWLHVQALEREDARPYLRKALEVSPEHRNSALLLAKLTAEMGKPEEGRDALFAVLKRTPRDPEVLFELGASFDQGGSEELAMARYREAIDAAPNHAPALNNLAMHLKDQPGRAEEARGLIERALRAVPDNPVYLDTLGQVQLALRNRSEAERALVGAFNGFLSRRNELEARLTMAGPKERALYEKLKAEMAIVTRQIEETKQAIAKAKAGKEGD